VSLVLSSVTNGARGRAKSDDIERLSFGGTAVHGVHPVHPEVRQHENGAWRCYCNLPVFWGACRWPAGGRVLHARDSKTRSSQLDQTTASTSTSTLTFGNTKPSSGACPAVERHCEGRRVCSPVQTPSRPTPRHGHETLFAWPPSGTETGCVSDRITRANTVGRASNRSAANEGVSQNIIQAEGAPVCVCVCEMALASVAAFPPPVRTTARERVRGNS